MVQATSLDTKPKLADTPPPFSAPPPPYTASPPALAVPAVSGAPDDLDIDGSGGGSEQFFDTRCGSAPASIKSDKEAAPRRSSDTSEEDPPDPATPGPTSRFEMRAPVPRREKGAAVGGADDDDDEKMKRGGEDSGLARWRVGRTMGRRYRGWWAGSNFFACSGTTRVGGFGTSAPGTASARTTANARTTASSGTTPYQGSHRANTATTAFEGDPGCKHGHSQTAEDQEAGLRLRARRACTPIAGAGALPALRGACGGAPGWWSWGVGARAACRGGWRRSTGCIMHERGMAGCGGAHLPVLHDDGCPYPILLPLPHHQPAPCRSATLTPPLSPHHNNNVRQRKSWKVQRQGCRW